MLSHLQVQTVTLIPGDGIGPEISAAVMKIFDAAKVSGLPKKKVCLKLADRRSQLLHTVSCAHFHEDGVFRSLPRWSLPQLMPHGCQLLPVLMQETTVPSVGY